LFKEGIKRELFGIYVPPRKFFHYSSQLALLYIDPHLRIAAWEDPANAKGGSWSIQLSRDRSRDMIDKWWLYTVSNSQRKTLNESIHTFSTKLMGRNMYI
jgi:hypothetical protein